jgi:hypothetical protein
LNEKTEHLPPYLKNTCIGEAGGAAGRGFYSIGEGDGGGTAAMPGKEMGALPTAAAPRMEMGAPPAAASPVTEMGSPHATAVPGMDLLPPTAWPPPPSVSPPPQPSSPSSVPGASTVLPLACITSDPFQHRKGIREEWSSDRVTALTPPLASVPFTR